MHSDVSEMMTRQHELEREMTTSGVTRYFAALQKAKAEGRATENPAGQRLLTAAVEPMQKAVEAYLADARSGKPGRAAAATKAIETLDPAAVAYITARSVLDKAMAGQVSLQQAAIATASFIEYEVRVKTYAEVEKDKYDLTQKHLKGTRHERHRRRVLVFQMNKAGMAWQEWPDNKKALIGTKLVEMFAEATGLVEIIQAERGAYKVRPTTAMLEWIEKANARHSLLCPVYMPCLVPPKPWTTPLNGGYHTDAVRRVTLIKTRSKGFIDELFNADLSQVYDALNTLQNTAWRVNPAVLEVAKEMWDRSLGLGKVLPSREVTDIPAKPAWLAQRDPSQPLPDLSEEQKAEFKAWKGAAAEAHTAHARSLSRRLQAARILSIAERFAPEQALYFPYSLDFRGRIYATPPFLNPQGNDLAKGLLTFAAGKPIGDAAGPGWLAIHGANVYGYDKASLEDRIAWVEENQEAILAVAADPLSNTFWQDADSPWSFLAFCFEWAGYIREGAAFVSSLPVALDGSCNGIQHFSAMLRDPVGGAAVNLVPADKPSDIYGKVAEVTAAHLKEQALDVSLDRSTRETVEAWIAFGIDRKITKRSVMVLPYGGTYASCKDYVQQAVEERLAATGEVLPWSGDRAATNTAIHVLAKAVWVSISKVVVAAKDAMAWLQSCARLASKTDLPINWRTPSGLWVQQAYKEAKRYNVKIHLLGREVQLKLVGETAQIDGTRQVQAIAPNFVHSLDAAALTVTVNTAAANGVTSFAMIHDSYGTVAADTDMLGACLRHAFVDLYKNHDVLAEFRESIVAMLPPELAEKVPPLPAKGDLDIEAVLGSDFFFA